MEKPETRSLTVRLPTDLMSDLSSYVVSRGLTVTEAVRLAVAALVGMPVCATQSAVDPRVARVLAASEVVNVQLAKCEALPFSERPEALAAIVAYMSANKPVFDLASKADPTYEGAFKALVLGVKNRMRAKVSKDEVKAELRSREPARAESMASYNLDDPLDTSHLATPEELAHFSLPASFNDTYGSPYTTQEDFQIRSDISWLRGHLGGRSVHPPVGESELGTAHLLWSIEFYEAVSPDSDRLAQLKEFRDTGTYAKS